MLLGGAAVLWWLVILAATLMPLPDQAPRSALTPLGCLVCGEAPTSSGGRSRRRGPPPI
jgi:hypothetical protein